MNRSQADIPKYLWDARQAAERVRRFTAGRTLDQYLQDDMLRSAVERQFQIIGEALGSVRRIDSVMASTIPDASRIIAFRNVVVHAYARIDHDLVWRVVQNDLEALIATLSALLDQETN